MVSEALHALVTSPWMLLVVLGILVGFFVAGHQHQKQLFFMALVLGFAITMGGLIIQHFILMPYLQLRILDLPLDHNLAFGLVFFGSLLFATGTWVGDWLEQVLHPRSYRARAERRARRRQEAASREPSLAARLEAEPEPAPEEHPPS
jgi:cytochrome b subunit of formate dehydrogenase